MAIDSNVVHNDQFLEDIEIGKGSFSNAGDSSDWPADSTRRDSLTTDSQSRPESVISRVKGELSSSPTPTIACLQMIRFMASAM